MLVNFFAHPEEMPSEVCIHRQTRHDRRIGVLGCTCGYTNLHFSGICMAVIGS